MLRLNAERRALILPPNEPVILCQLSWSPDLWGRGVDENGLGKEG